MTTTENSNRITIACEQEENIAYLERIQRPLKNEASYDSKSDFEYFEDVLKIKNNIDRENKIKQLIKDDVNINATKDGKTILDIAIEKRCSPEIVKSLVSNGGKINTIDADGRTVLHRSVKNKNRKVVEVLLEANKKEVLWHPLTRLSLSFMLYHSIEVNAKDNDNFTALDYAHHGSEMYSLLQKYGAQHSEKFLYLRNLNIEELDLNKLVSDNNYCFDIFTKALEIEDTYNKKETIDWLLNNGANINVIKDNQALLSITAAKGDVENAVLLLERGARGEINSQDAEGRTLLLNAIIQDKLDHAKYLMKQKVNANIPDNNGNSLLHYAVVNTADATFYDLLKNGADFYIKNHDNLTAFEYAFHVGVAPGKAVYLFKLYIEKGDQDKNTQLVKILDYLLVKHYLSIFSTINYLIVLNPA